MSLVIISVVADKKNVCVCEWWHLREGEEY